MKIPAAPNLNYAWSGVMIRELMRLGAGAFFIAPGSRSSPLAITAAELAGENAIVHFDERGLGFMALGHARATGRPAVVITTSGSAVANIFPAVCEASQDEVPMIVITADRPPELRGNGANQAMDQVKLFGSYARWFMDLPCPSTDVPATFLVGTLDHAWLMATGSHPGPVHINQMFREPLAPLKNKDGADKWQKTLAGWWARNKPYTTIGAPENKVELPEDIARVVSNAKRGVIIAGSLSNPSEAASIIQIARKLNWPVLADIRSGLRFSPDEQVIRAIEALLIAQAPGSGMKPDVVLHIGRQLVSKRLLKFAASADEIIHVQSSPSRHDPESCQSYRLAGFVPFDQWPARTATPASWLNKWKRLGSSAEKSLARHLAMGFRLTEPLAAAVVAKTAPAGGTLFAASSMPIRDLNAYAVPGGEPVAIVANRGVSGIDGNLATAAGYAMASRKPMTVLIGDQALLHDLNSLAIVRSIRAAFTVVVINNDGGGIFSMLPIAGTTAHFEKVFGARHGLPGFAHAASLFGMDYAKPADLVELADAIKKGKQGGRHQLIEVCTSRGQNVIDHEHINHLLKKALKHGA